MYSKVQAKNYEVKMITGIFDIAASTYACTKVAGLGYTVTKLSTAGEYEINFTDKYSYILSAVANLELAAGTVASAAIKSSSATSVIFKLCAPKIDTGAIALDTFAGPCKVHFAIHMQRTSLPAV